MTVLAVFRSRAQALDAIALLKNAGVPARAGATPREAGCGCGISAAFDARFFVRAKQLVQARCYSSFYGYYKACGGTFLRC